MKKGFLYKGIAIFFVFFILLGALLVLRHPVKGGKETETLLPAIADTPVYVECEKGSTLNVLMRAKEDFHIGGFRLLLVNISEESKGTLRLALQDEEKNLLMEQIIPVDTIVPGEWFLVPADAVFGAGQEYVFSLKADGSDPYFMQLPLEEANNVLPFEERVSRNGEEIESRISLGVDVVTDSEITFGDIFYFSIPALILAAAMAVLWILFGKEKIFMWLGMIPVRAFLQKYGNDIFLILLFVSICISIYARAYIKGVYITADSAGYLREAVNLVNGNGFRYDGLAGYDSWFANWPILYPAMIALVMLVTNTNAYLASKLLSMLIVGVILLLLRRYYGKDAWVYSLCLTNIGFLSLTYYTWSELPFMLFLLCFALVFAHILKEEMPSVIWYILLGVSGFVCFLTRYYGLYIWIVVGVYLLWFVKRYWETREKETLHKGIGIAVAAFCSGMASIGYFLLNKKMNGMVSGVSRSLWWDDYEKLTNDLIESLLTEIFNVFSLQVPQIIDNCPYSMKVLFLAAVLAGLVWLIWKNCSHFSTESVLIALAVGYDIIFVGIRYVSSMDTFYFRFFEPATFLFSLGLVGLLLPYLRGKKGFCYFTGLITTVILIAVISLFQNNSMNAGRSYYKSLCMRWDDAYAEIPERSVVIFSDLDFRASWYRPDVMEGMIVPEDTWESLQSTYSGSDYLCVRTGDARLMVDEGEYDRKIKQKLAEALDGCAPGKEYIVIALRE